MSVRLTRSIAGTREIVRQASGSGVLVGLVPTMGALHAGHARLMERARAECGYVVASVFVNPIQFNQKEDYERYPQSLEADVEFCGRLGVDLVFAPGVDEMYPQAQRTRVDVGVLTDHLCGRFRPGHFQGVATVVTKLFGIVQPDRAYFGEKDAQQLAVIRRMAADLNIPVEIIGVPTVREPDGLALSSRNQHLSAEERRAATILYRALQAAERAIAAGERDSAKVRQDALDVLLQEPLARAEYLEVVDTAELQPVTTIAGSVLVTGAVWLGNTRLIDNVTCRAARATGLARSSR